MDSRIEAWRTSGDDCFDRVRFRFIEALARRAEGHDGEARRLVDARLAALLAAYEADLVTASDAGAAARDAREAAVVDAEAAGRPDTLATLVAELAQQQGAGELKTLSYFRGTWSKLSADRRLTQSLAKVPDNAGPLNSHQLVHRALTLMHALSPDYLNRFMAYVDALMWTEGREAGGTAGVEAEGPARPARPVRAPRAAGPRKGGPRKAA